MQFWSRVLTLLLVLAVALPATAMAGGGKAATDTKSPSMSQATPGGETKSPQPKGQSDADVKGKDSSGQASPPTAPASKDACKDNGWQKYGFKSEAECVSAVPASGAGEKKQ